MSWPAFEMPTLGGYVNEKIRQAVRAWVELVRQRMPHIDAELLEDVDLANGTTTLVEHKLGRAYRGWRVSDTTAAATIYRDTTSTADTTRYLPLVASAATTVSLEVF